MPTIATSQVPITAQGLPRAFHGSAGSTPRRLSRTRYRLAALWCEGGDLATLRDRWKHLEPAFGNEFVRNISHARMQGYVDARRDEGAADQTIKNEIGALRRMLRLGYEKRKVGQLPPFPKIEVDNARSGFFEEAEFDRLMTTIRAAIAEGRDIGNDWLVPFVIVSRYIGTRRDELLTLERRQLDLDAGKLTLESRQHEERRGPCDLPPGRSARCAPRLG